jgi:hypothetical protein
MANRRAPRYGSRMRRLVLEQPPSRAAIWSNRVVLFALVVVAYGVVVVRGGQQGWPALAALGAGFGLAAVSLGLAGLAAVGIWRLGLKGFGRVVLTVLLALALLSAPAAAALQFFRLPPLGDISTDLEDAPAFSRSRAVLAAREGHVPRELAREERGAQRAAYQRIVPVVVDVAVEEALAVTTKAAQRLGWRVIETTPPSGRTGIARLEAIAETPILRLRHDVTIRIRPRVDGARIDIRSASRLDGHDLGANAAKVLALIGEIESDLSRR